MKNPNGYGSVVKLSGRRRNPYAVRKTTGYDDRAFPIYSIVGYYPTRKDALIALAEYNAKPYDVDRAKLTLCQLFEEWSVITFPRLSTSLKSALRAAYRYCSNLYSVPYRDIRKTQMQRCIDECGKSYSTQASIKNLFSHLDRYAFDNDIISKCYSENLTIGEKTVKIKRTIFSDAEVKTLWEHQGESGVDEILFMLFTGCRLTEMLTMETANVDTENRTMRGGVKTAAGKNRLIPIHSQLLPIVERHLSDGRYLFSVCSETAKDLSRKSAFERTFAAVMDRFQMEHKSHDCRHTFRTRLDAVDANKVCIDLIMGHKTGDVGERVYTHKTTEELKQTVEKLSYNLPVSAG